MHNKSNRSPVVEYGAINLDKLEVASLPPETSRMEKSTTPSKKITRRAEKYSDSSDLQQLSERNTAEHSGTAGAINNTAEKAKKTAKDTPQIPKDQSRPLVHFSFDDRRSTKLPSRYIELSLPVDNVGCSWGPSCHQPWCVWEVESDEKYEHVSHLLRALLIRNSLSQNILSSKESHKTQCGTTALQLCRMKTTWWKKCQLFGTRRCSLRMDY